MNRLGSGWFRSHTTIASYLDGLQILPPGLVTPNHWWPPGPTSCAVSTEEKLMLAGVAQKPFTAVREKWQLAGGAQRPIL